MRHRPIGIGVQGLADAFMSLRMPFDSPQARQLNLQIFETIYHAAIESSADMARDYHIAHPELEGGWYETYKKGAGSPASNGDLQYDLWGVTPSDLWDWAALKDHVKTFGLRNSLVCAPMPTASTSQILGFNECFEPYTSFVSFSSFLRLKLIRSATATSTLVEYSLESSKSSILGCFEISSTPISGTTR